MLEELLHFFHLLLNFFPVVHNILKILKYTILNHLVYHLCIILCDHVFWRCSLCLHLLVRTPYLSRWPLSQAWFFWIRIWCSPLPCLILFLLYLGQLCIILLPVLGPHLGCPFIHLLCFGLDHASLLGHLGFLRLCFFLA
jgi:hypothetical protein